MSHPWTAGLQGQRLRRLTTLVHPQLALPQAQHFHHIHPPHPLPLPPQPHQPEDPPERKHPPGACFVFSDPPPLFICYAPPRHLVFCDCSARSQNKVIEKVSQAQNYPNITFPTAWQMKSLLIWWQRLPPTCLNSKELLKSGEVTISNHRSRSVGEISVTLTRERNTFCP